MILQTFGEEIRRARELRQWTQQRLADELRVSQVTIHKIEKGEQSVSLERAADIARVLDISLDKFVEKKIKDQFESELVNHDVEIKAHIIGLLKKYADQAK